VKRRELCGGRARRSDMKKTECERRAVAARKREVAAGRRLNVVEREIVALTKRRDRAYVTWLKENAAALEAEARAAPLFAAQEGGA